MSYDNSGFDLVPGLANFMEDTNVEVDVEVGDAPEEVENDTEAVESAEEVGEAQEEQAKSEEQVEMINRRFDELARMHAHIQKYGVSRDFMAWVNYDGKLAAGLNVAIPSLESIDAIGDPNSSLSIACMESIGESIKKGAKAVWEFIKRIAQKIWNFIQRIFEFIKRLVLNTNRNIGRLKKALAKRDNITGDADNDKVTVKILDTGDLTEAIKGAGGQIVQEIDTAAKNLEKAFHADPANFMNAINNMNTDGIEKAINDFAPKFTSGKYDKAKASEKKKPTNPKGEAEALLKLASDEMTFVNGTEGVGKIVGAAAKAALTFCNKAEQRDDLPEGVTKKAREFASKLNKVSGFVGKLIKHHHWIANQAVRSASIIMTRYTKKNSK